MPTDGEPRLNGVVHGLPLRIREGDRLSIVSRSHRDVACWLLNQEMLTLAADQDALPEALERVCQKFFSRLSRVTSLASCQALLSRALHTPRADFAFLEGVRAGPNAELLIDGLRASVEGIDAVHVRGGLEAVLGTFIDLLESFIGRDLTMGMLREVWPGLPADLHQRPRSGSRA